MSNLERAKIAKDDINKYFDSLPYRVFKKKDISKILGDNLDFWRLTRSISPEEFIQILTQITDLHTITLESSKYKKKLTRYIWGKDTSSYEIALSIKPNSYLSHYTAMFVHSLTQQIPKTIYVNQEQTKKPERETQLEQERIDAAFSRKARVSQYIFSYENWNICCLSGKNTNNLGAEEITVSDKETLLVTNIERTLIDIAVRPIYSGGVFEVLNAYKEAKGRFSINKLLSVLKKINYAYPYHQVIGFYLQRAGYKDSLLALFKQLGMHYDFYLDYDIKEKEYSDEWRLYFPKNL